MSRAEKNIIDKKKFRKKIIIICILIFALMYMGIIYGANIYKGDVNGDGVVNYADVSLVQLHLISSKAIPEDKLKNADMNGDGQITVTDLTLMIQKIEKKLEYEVDILSIEPDTYYPQKNHDLVLRFDANVSYGGIIDRVVINGERYQTKINENTGLYEVSFNVRTSKRH